ncbi:MAG: c-type cytochrome [Methylocystis sp.]|nr:c-type cytochrome [Methylocystis sp.]MCA3583886.1 c-type cytochrome [Methylocystis sp.]MCA3587673.1 c-type cytochrome [Methylocystis sp.]MCA3593154.1 c-type cytochrome [Methylocystis sp.]
MRKKLAAAFLLAILPLPASPEMRGHGGPVRALAVSADGETAISGGLDTSVIRWSVEKETAEQVLRFHAGGITSVAALPDGWALSGGEDGRIALWKPGEARPATVLDGHKGPVSALAIAEGIGGIASASWDGTARVWIGSGILSNQPQVFEGHKGNVNGVAFGPTQTTLITAGYDAALRITPLTGGAPTIVRLPTPLNALRTAFDGEIIAGGADGKVYIRNGGGSERLTVEVQEMPITSLALSADSALIAVAGLRGAVTIISRETGKVVSTLVGPGLPVWSLAFHPDGKILLTGGADRMIRKWDVATGQPLAPAHAPKPDFPAAAMNERGAQVFRACEACHTVTPDGGNRAGPTLHGVFGRKIGSAKDYAYSDGFAGHGITWNAETIARLFRDGPAKVTPGTRMPEQKITDPEDLAALVEWLGRVTR